MPIYWLQIDVKFREPMELKGAEDGVKIYGYLQDIGATFPDEEVLKSSIVELVYEDEFMDATNVEITYEYIGVIPPDRAQKEIYGDSDIAHQLLSDPTNDGIWYQTGRGFYSDHTG